MMPKFDERGQLPPGIHRLAWPEFASAFGYNDWRRALIKGMRRALANLKRAGCLAVYIDGSFVTRRPYPHDYSRGHKFLIPFWEVRPCRHSPGHTFL